MQKLPDWEARLTALVTQAHSRPFGWGHSDCCIWAADCVEAQTGIDHAKELRGTYSSAAEAVEILRLKRGLRGIVSSVLGAPISTLMASHGDIGLVRGDGRSVLALCNGDHWLALGKSGLVVVPFLSATMAWSVSNA